MARRRSERLVDVRADDDETKAQRAPRRSDGAAIAAAIQGLMLQMGMGLNMGGMQMPPKEGARRP